MTDENDETEHRSNIRDPHLLGPLVGETVVDVTDEEDRILLHFSNGMTLKFEGPFQMQDHPAYDGDDEDLGVDDPD